MRKISTVRYGLKSTLLFPVKYQRKKSSVLEISFGVATIKLQMSVRKSAQEQIFFHEPEGGSWLERSLGVAVTKLKIKVHTRNKTGRRSWLERSFRSCRFKT